MAYSLGIDLGTTYSAAATARDDRVEIFQLGERAATIPSIVVLRADGEVLTGDAAERRSLAEPTRTAREFKRRLGDPTPIILGGTPYGAEALLAHLLRSIVTRVSEQSGGPPDAIALCHPASYGAYKIDLLEQAVRQADIANVSLLTEPEAAAVHYAQQERVPAGTIVAVYDFGGGTFDATILRKTETGFEQLGRPEGMERLGGIDFDEALFTRAMAVVRSSGAVVDANDPATLAAIARLREECRRAKEGLSSDTDATIQVVLPGLQTEVRLTREEFEEMIRPRIRETIGALGRAAKSAGLGFDGVDRVLLVGGSSRIPLVAEMVREATGRPIAVDAHPKHSMALGAAYVAEQGRKASLAAAAGPASAATATALSADAGADAPVRATGATGAQEDVAATGGVAAFGAPGAALAAGAAAAAFSGGPPPGPAQVPAGAAGEPPPPPPPPTTTVPVPGPDRRPVIIGAAVVGAIVLVILIVVGASGILSGGGPKPSSSIAALVSPSTLASLSPSPSTTPTPSSSLAPTPSPTPTPAPTATPAPTPSPTPAGRQARITSIKISGGRYVVDYDVFGYTPVLPGRHLHFFFDTVKQIDAGIPGKGPWIIYAGPKPFTEYKVSARPAGAQQMCVLVANTNHSVVQNTGNCMDLPS
jgi:molecular chaperone DnaK